ncbi:MAG: type I-E CRISPR-associated protein Cse1/CasA [PVC group bacterium]|nr:type I-E CRISPR-associated protein Cse1/CasA [PVC group bacterium]
MGIHDKNHFNLVEEPWIPVADKGLVSLCQVFSDSSLKALGGNPVQKIALTKLLLAITQAAFTPKNADEWATAGIEGMTSKTLAYLEQKKDLFWLYGEKPFLQMPSITKAEKQSYGAVLIHIATGNTTILLQSQTDHNLTDAEKALIVVVLMGFAPGGKKTDNSVILSSGYKGKENKKGKPSTGKPGPSLGFMGYLHSFINGISLNETIWLNLLCQTEVSSIKIFTEGCGVVPWEKMPTGEDDLIARNLKCSYMGRLVPVSRFVYLAENGIHYSEGIAHPTHKEGCFDPSISVDFSNKPKAMWVDPEKRPWRQLTSLLSFVADGKTDTFECLQLRTCISRVGRKIHSIGIWSGGLRVKSNAGEQFVSGMNDFVESEVFLQTEWFGKNWFAQLKAEMDILEELSKISYSATNRYFKHQFAVGKKQAGQATNLFWQLCERKFQKLVDICGESTSESVKETRKTFVRYVDKVYNTYCPRNTARQLDAWAANRPNCVKFLTKT